MRRSNRPRADQCTRRHDSVTAMPPPSLTRSPQSRPSASIAGSARAGSTSLPSGVMTRGGSVPAAESEGRQVADGRNGRATPARRRSAGRRVPGDARLVAPGCGPARANGRGAHPTTPGRPGCSARRPGPASWRGRRARQPHLAAGRRAAAACRRSGLGTQSGQSARRALPRPNRQRSTCDSDFGGEPSGSKNWQAVEMIGSRAVS